MEHDRRSEGDAPQAPRVLVVDDEDTIRDTLVDILGGNGYVAVGATDGEDALRKLRAPGEPWDLILLDLTMPVMDGATFRDEQRRDPALAAIPVVVVSAYRDVAAKAADLRAAAYLSKPLNVPLLLDLLRTHAASTHLSTHQ
jgi:CheY-like chemotaxis protein